MNNFSDMTNTLLEIHDDDTINNIQNDNYKFAKILKDVKKIKDFKNGLEHEQAVKIVLDKHLNSEIDNPLSGNGNSSCNKIIIHCKENNKLKSGEYIYQPCGSQNHPDFLIRLGDEYIQLECKSSKGNKPMYNSGGIHQDSIYIFSSQKNWRNTYFFGEDVNPKKVYDYNKETENIVRKLVKERNDLILEMDENEFKNCIYPRLALEQKGNIDYFNEKSIQREKIVNDYINNL
tara:strand:- start:1441 stop:2139 length:699 start_codon:yes stop_codon:yes gene_type:complete